MRFSTARGLDVCRGDWSSIIDTLPRCVPVPLTRPPPPGAAGWENIELISDRPLEVMLKEFRQLKAEFPDRCAEGGGRRGPGALSTPFASQSLAELQRMK